MSKSIKKNAFYNVLLNISQVLFPLITAPYVSRVLEPDGVGLINFSNTYAGYFALVALLGIPTYGVREIAKSKDDKKAMSDLVSQLMSIATLTTIVVSLVYFLTIAFMGQLSENYLIFILAGFAVYLAPFKINWYYQGIEEFGFITLRSLIIRILAVVSLFVFVHDKNDLIIYLIINVLSGALGDVWNYTKMWKAGIRPRFTLSGLKQHINPLLVLFASSIAISIYTVLDTLMLGFITDYEEVGYYTNSMHMSRILISAVTSLSVVAVPRVSYYMKNNDYCNINQLLDKSFSVVSFLAFPVAIGMCCVSSSFVPLFFGHLFEGSVAPLMILSFLIISIGLNNLTGVQILIGMGYDKQFLYSVLIGTISNFILNLTLIPLMGAVGASFASVVAETLILFVTSYYVYRCTPVRFSKWMDIFKALVGSLSFIPIIMMLDKFLVDWWLVGGFVIIGGFVYLIIEVLLHNSSVDLFKGVVLNKIRKNEKSY